MEIICITFSCDTGKRKMPCKHKRNRCEHIWALTDNHFPLKRVHSGFYGCVVDSSCFSFRSLSLDKQSRLKNTAVDHQPAVYVETRSFKSNLEFISLFYLVVKHKNNLNLITPVSKSSSVTFSFLCPDVLPSQDASLDLCDMLRTRNHNNKTTRKVLGGGLTAAVLVKNKASYLYERTTETAKTQIRWAEGWVSRWPDGAGTPRWSHSASPWRPALIQQTDLIRSDWSFQGQRPSADPTSVQTGTQPLINITINSTDYCFD